MADKLALSISEAATLLGVSRPTMYNLIHKDGFPVFAIGRRRLIPVDELREWLRQQSKEA